MQINAFVCVYPRSPAVRLGSTSCALPQKGTDMSRYGWLKEWIYRRSDATAYKRLWPRSKGCGLRHYTVLRLEHLESRVALSITTTSILSHGPNPALIGQGINFTVAVNGGTPIDGESVILED